jgi:Fe2+ or Zn2+ uptake regulation protein
MNYPKSVWEPSIATWKSFRTGNLQKTVFPDGKARYEGANNEHHHHMVCMGCSSILDISLCPLGPEIKQLLNTEDFEAVYHRFEVYGYCKDCRKKD